MPTQMITLADLRTANVARDAEWCPSQKPDLSFRGNELAGETGEACNVIKKLERERQGWAGSRATAEHLAEELADVVISADLTAMTAGIDLAAAVMRKFDATSEKYGLATRLSAALAQGEPVAVPAGYKPVPVEPTAEMVEAGGNYVLGVGGIDPMHVDDRGAPHFLTGRESGSAGVYRAMLAAAPAAPIASPAPMVADGALRTASRRLSAATRALLRFTNPCLVSEDHSQQWQAVHHLIEMVEDALASAPPAPVASHEPASVSNKPDCVSSAGDNAPPAKSLDDGDDSGAWYPSVQVEEIERLDRLTPCIQHSRGVDNAYMADDLDGKYVRLADVLKTLTPAAPPPEPAKAEVVVKPLEWVDDGGGHAANSEVGTYYVYETDPSGYRVDRNGHVLSVDAHNTLDAAKAYAQADYERRARSLYDATPTAHAAEVVPGASYGIIDPDYARVFVKARAIAWQEGYAIMMHGSFTRDLDLLAVPWTEHACEPEHLVKRLEFATGLKHISKDPGVKPHGRLAWTLTFPEFGDPRFVDVGVMPRLSTAPTAARSAAEEMRKRCAKIVEQWADAISESGYGSIAFDIGDSIRAISLPGEEA